MGEGGGFSKEEEGDPSWGGTVERGGMMKGSVSVVPKATAKKPTIKWFLDTVVFSQGSGSYGCEVEGFGKAGHFFFPRED